MLDPSVILGTAAVHPLFGLENVVFDEDVSHGDGVHDVDVRSLGDQQIGQTRLARQGENGVGAPNRALVEGTAVMDGVVAPDHVHGPAARRNAPPPSVAGTGAQLRFRAPLCLGRARPGPNS